MDKYAWQDTLYEKWSDAGYFGLVKGVVSCGKTKAGCKCILSYMQDFGEDREIWVVAPTHEILQQWMDEPTIKDYKYDIKFYTYLTAVSRMKQRANLCATDVPDLLILDEAHSAMAPVMGQVLDFKVPHVLALTATPKGIEKVIPICEEVKWECANIAPTTVHYIFFTPTKQDMDAYIKKTNSIKKYEQDHYPGFSPYQLYGMRKKDQIYQKLYIFRRSVVYAMSTRRDIALSIVKENISKRMIIFFERINHVLEFSKILSDNDISHCIHVNGKEELNKYLSHEVDIVLCCQRLSAGFSDPSTEVGIIVSTALGKANHIQRVGRIIRPAPGKYANVYVILADGTTDTTLYDDRNDMFPTDMCVKEYASKYLNS